jgi:hypothetical protein
MKSIFPFLLFSLFAQSAYSQCFTPIPANQFTYGGHVYEIVKQKKTWQSAANCAVTRNAKLVEIGSAAENTAVKNALLAAGFTATETNSVDGGNINYVWIGASDLFTEGSWIWDGDNNSVGTNFWIGEGIGASPIIPGAAVGTNYVNWGRDGFTGAFYEPDNSSDQDCAAMGLAEWPLGGAPVIFGVAGEWNDLLFTNTLYYVVEYNSTPMPIQLVDFQAVGKGSEVALSWETSLEINNRGFQIERMDDKNNWQNIAFVNANTDKNDRKIYHFSDKNPNFSIGYYRLGQVDNDGQITYSAVKFARLDKKSDLKIFPNPAQNVFVMTGLKPQTCHMKVIDAEGKVFIQREINTQNEVEVSELSAGIYWVILSNDELQEVVRFVKN